MNLIKSQKPLFPSLVDEFLKNDWQVNVPSFSTTVPAVNIKETDTAFHLDLAAPGKQKSDFEVEIDDNVLSISSKTSEEKKCTAEKYTRMEYSYNSFRRTFTIPDSVNLTKIEANYSEGILSVILPKRKEALPQPKKVVKIQ